MSSVKWVVVALGESGFPEACTRPFLALVSQRPSLAPRTEGRSEGGGGDSHPGTALPFWGLLWAGTAASGYLHPVYPLSVSQRPSQGRDSTPQTSV